MTKKTIYDLKLHESLEITDALGVTRVPNGWLYTTATIFANRMVFSQVFIPYHKEFLTELTG